MNKIMVIMMMSFLSAGCAVLTPLPFTDDARKYQAANTFFEQGNYKDAHVAYRSLADARPRSTWVEQSKFNAAYVLVYYKNTSKDYTKASQEFEEFLNWYPKSTLAGEANTWLDTLKMFEQTKAGELMKEVASLTTKIESVSQELLESQTNREAIMKEKDLLLIEKTNLGKKVVDLLNEKEDLIRGKAALVKDNEALGKDKAVLDKKIDSLNRERQKLIRAKEKLEKSLHDLTMVDVKMEKKRKRIQNEEKK